MVCFICFSVVGEIEAMKVSVDLNLVEFRAFIERINAQSMYELDHLMKESTDFEYCYKHFLACQGKSVSCNFWLPLFVLCFVFVPFIFYIFYIFYMILTCKHCVYLYLLQF